MNLRQVFKHTCANIEAGNATIWKGPPGLGKTDAVGRVFSWFCQQNPGKHIGISTFFMATQSEIGFTGLPWKGEKDFGNGIVRTVTDPAVPQWYMATDPKTGERKPADMFDYVFLVIEEWGQGSLETKRAGAEVLRAGGTPPWFLPEGSPRLALSNSDARDGVTKEFDFIINRRSELEVTGDADVWLEDFADKPYAWQGRVWDVMPVTKVWVKQNPVAMFEAKPEKQGPWCTPRSLVAADRYAQCMAAQNGGVLPVKDSGFTEAIAGTIGFAAAASFIGHMQFVLDLPAYEDVVAHPDTTPLPDKADLQLLMAYTLAGRAKDADLDKVIQYMSRKEMPKDMSITFVSSLLRRDWKAMIENPAMKAWISKNAALLSVIQTLSAPA